MPIPRRGTQMGGGGGRDVICDGFKLETVHLSVRRYMGKPTATVRRGNPAVKLQTMIHVAAWWVSK